MRGEHGVGHCGLSYGCANVKGVSSEGGQVRRAREQQESWVARCWKCWKPEQNKRQGEVRLYIQRFCTGVEGKASKGFEGQSRQAATERSAASGRGQVPPGRPGRT